MRSITIVAPTFVDIPRKSKPDKRVYINLNTYRNLHYAVNNKVKKMYLESIREQLIGVTIETPCEITYKVYKPTRRRLDKMNVVAVCSKYLLDAITELGCWEDDNDEFVKTETILPTEYDKGNGRVEVNIKSLS